MAHKLIYLATAKADLEAIYDWVADHADPHTALAYTSRIESACERLTTFPGRGTPRDDILPGLRTFVVQRRDIVAYRVDGDTVSILGIIHRGRDLGMAFEEE